MKRAAVSTARKAEEKKIPWIVDWVVKNRIKGETLKDVIARCKQLKCDSETINRLNRIKEDIAEKTKVEKRMAFKKIKEGRTAELTPAEVRVMASVLEEMVKEMTPEERKKLKREVDDAIKWGDIKIEDV